MDAQEGVFRFLPAADDQEQRTSKEEEAKRFHVGARVQLWNLREVPAHNGMEGNVVGYVQSGSGVRCKVILEDGDRLRLRPQNLMLLSRQVTRTRPFDSEADAFRI